MLEKCLYHKVVNGKDIYILRQVDDIAIATDSKMLAENTIKEIGNFLMVWTYVKQRTTSKLHVRNI